MAQQDVTSTSRSGTYYAIFKLYTSGVKEFCYFGNNLSLGGGYITLVTIPEIFKAKKNNNWLVVTGTSTSGTVEINTVCFDHNGYVDFYKISSYTISNVCISHTYI